MRGKIFLRYVRMGVRLVEREKVTRVVHDVLGQIQTRQNLDCPAIDGNTKPLRDLKRFDSPMSIAATGMIGRRLGIRIPTKTNVFGDKSGLFTIDRTVRLLCKLADEYSEAELMGV